MGWLYVKKKKNKAHQPGHWEEKKKVEAVTTYIATGNYALTAKMINVPEPTIRFWKSQEWWKQMVEDVYQEGNLQLSSKLSKTLEKSIDAVNDRLENGDFVYNPKTGAIVRVQANLRDVHRVASDLIDKQLVLRKGQHQQVESQESTDGRLLKLAEQFAKFAQGLQGKDVTPNVIVEGEFEDVPDEIMEAANR